jgi:hypothetical protein
MHACMYVYTIFVLFLHPVCVVVFGFFNKRENNNNNDIAGIVNALFLCISESFIIVRPAVSVLEIIRHGG